MHNPYTFAGEPKFMHERIQDLTFPQEFGLIPLISDPTKGMKSSSSIKLSNIYNLKKGVPIM